MQQWWEPIKWQGLFLHQRLRQSAYSCRSSLRMVLLVRPCRICVWRSLTVWVQVWSLRWLLYQQWVRHFCVRSQIESIDFSMLFRWLMKRFCGSVWNGKRFQSWLPYFYLVFLFGKWHRWELYLCRKWAVSRCPIPIRCRKKHRPSRITHCQMRLPGKCVRSKVLRRLEHWWEIIRPWWGFRRAAEPASLLMQWSFWMKSMLIKIKR